MNTPLGAEPKARVEPKTTGGRDRRATLQRLRQKENGSQSGNVFPPLLHFSSFTGIVILHRLLISFHVGRDSDNDSLVASANRSRLRAMRGSTRGDGIAAVNESVLDEEDEDEEDADGKLKKQEPQEIEEDYQDLVTMHEPLHMFPTNVWITPHTRDVENGLQPLLYRNPGHPKVTVPMLNCANCTMQNGFLRFHKHELDIITGKADVVDYSNRIGGLFGTGQPPEGEERDALLGENGKDQVAYLKLLGQGGLETLMTTFHQRQDGLYANTLPLMATTLMRAEVLDTRLPIATLVQNDICLSRATQRVLRDVRSGLDNGRHSNYQF